MSKQSDRTTRLAQALRANLRRRKAGGRPASGDAPAKVPPESGGADSRVDGETPDPAEDAGSGQDTRVRSSPKKP